MSISGWFHGKPFPRPAEHKEDVPEGIPLISDCKPDQISKYVAVDYLKQGTLQGIGQHYAENGNVCMQNFFNKETYSKLQGALENVQWRHRGPYNIRSYEVLDQEPKGILKLFSTFL